MSYLVKLIERTSTETSLGGGFARAGPIFSGRLRYSCRGSRPVLVLAGDLAFKIYNGRCALFKGFPNMRETGFLVYATIGYMGIHLRYLFNLSTLTHRNTKGAPAIPTRLFG